MDLNLTEDQLAFCAAVADFMSKEVTSERVRDAEPLGFDPGVWRGLVEMGVTSMGLPEAQGGTGAGHLDVALVCETFGESLAPVPLVENAVALRALARSSGAKDVLPAFADDGRVATLALRPARDGTFRLVPAGAVADLVLGLDGEEWIALIGDPPERDRPLATLGASPLGDRRAAEGKRTILAIGTDAREQFERALDEWRVFTAASLVGLARRALEMGIEYAKSREQFGVPIGSFQAVAHRLADAATEVDGAELLVREAAWAADEGLPSAAKLASMAFLHAGATAQLASEESLHFHGGYGFTLEYDIQLYFRRAKAWSLALAPPASEYQALADRVLAAPVSA